MPSALFGEQALRLVRQSFNDIDDKRRNPLISLPDAAMSALAVYSLKIPSLLKFEELKRNDAKKIQNIKQKQKHQNINLIVKKLLIK